MNKDEEGKEGKRKEHDVTERRRAMKKVMHLFYQKLLEMDWVDCFLFKSFLLQFF